MLVSFPPEKREKMRRVREREREGEKERMRSTCRGVKERARGRQAGCYEGAWSQRGRVEQRWIFAHYQK